MRRLENPTFSMSWATLLWSLHFSGAQVAEEARKWRLSNEDRKCAIWIIEHQGEFCEANKLPWPKIQRLMIQPPAAECCAFARATLNAQGLPTDGPDFIAERLSWPEEKLNPDPLIDGQDLISLGVKPGKRFKEVLDEARDQQLDGQLTNRIDALQWLHNRVDSISES